MCNCEFDADLSDPDENTREKSWHYLRQCTSCGQSWWGLHCPHDRYQNPCIHCHKTPDVIAEIER